MSTRPSGYARPEHDWYVEPDWCVDLLLDSIKFDGAVHDPCCGQGTIPGVVARRGYEVTGSDIVDRAEGRFTVENFLESDRRRENIICNPPYNLTEKFIRQAWRLVERRAAFVVPVKFLASQKRYPLFATERWERVLVLSRRPSMPPGGRGIKASGGSIDYCWIIWNRDHDWLEPTVVTWAK